jgi:dCTP diphosphatase
MKNLDLEKISMKLKQFSDERDWNQFHSIKNLSMALSVETSELVEIFQWMNEEDSNAVKDNAQLKKRVAEEVADIFMYLLRIVDKAEINLEVSVLDKLEKNAQKYPVDSSKGNSKKYNDF